MTLKWSGASAAAVGALVPGVLSVQLLLSAPRGGVAESPFACSPIARPANLTTTLKDLDNNDVTFSQFKGKVILLNFWATWCGPCRIEIPWFVDMQTRYRSAGLQVLGISIDDTPALLVPYAAEYKMNYPVLLGLGHKDVLAPYGPITGVPTSFIISRDGKLCAKHIGATGKESFEVQVRGLLQLDR